MCESKLPQGGSSAQARPPLSLARLRYNSVSIPFLIMQHASRPVRVGTGRDGSLRAIVGFPGFPPSCMVSSRVQPVSFHFISCGRQYACASWLRWSEWNSLMYPAFVRVRFPFCPVFCGTRGPCVREEPVVCDRTVVCWLHTTHDVSNVVTSELHFTFTLLQVSSAPVCRLRCLPWFPPTHPYSEYLILLHYN